MHRNGNLVSRKLISNAITAPLQQMWTFGTEATDFLCVYTNEIVKVYSLEYTNNSKVFLHYCDP